MESFSAETNSTDLHSQTWYKPQIIFSMVILSLTFLLGLPGNGLVLWVAGLKMQRTVNTVWFLHLTLADLLCCLSLPFSLAHLALQGYWPYGWFLCKLIPSIIILNMFASVFVLTAISLDRCLMVLKPIWCQNHRDVRTAWIICGCIWVVAFVMCIPVFIYRETSTIDNHKKCGYNFGLSGSDYLYYSYDLDLPENRSVGNSIVLLPRKKDDRLHPSSFQTDDHPWTATSDFHSQTFQRSSGDSFPMASGSLSSQHPHYNVLIPADQVVPAIPSGFPMEDLRTDIRGISDAFLSTDFELFPSASSDDLYVWELAQDLQDDNSDEFMYDSQLPTPLVAITISRLVLGFLLPFVIMVACYSLIVLRMRHGNFTKSRRKIFRVAVVVVIVFLVCWTPYHVFGLLLLFTSPKDPSREALESWDHISIALASANSCLNPFLYTLMGKDFRRKAKQSMKGILEAAFSEELTLSTSCTQNKNFLDKKISTSV